ncbi:MAG: VCBS repeat-containing protein [Acidobacteria bacterium]|nr:VCBS repeat-containing protein [Acidobacteriota bacterium]
MFTRCMLLLVLSAPMALPLEFTEALISKDFTYPYGLAAADLDGDGDLDLTASDARDNNSLYWFENKGSGKFEKHVMHRQPMPAWRMERHAIADFNKDGRPDVVVVENSTGDLRWLENPGAPGIRQPWPVHFITRSDAVPGAYDVAVADFDGDGDLDVAASSWRRGNMFTWHENPGKPNELWKMHTIAVNLAETRTVRAADFDGDGDPDILGTASGAGMVLWFENPGKAGGVWKQHVIGSSPRPIHGEPVDLDGDGDLDVVMCLGMGATLTGLHNVPQKLVWYENLGGAARWKEHVVQQPFENAFDVVAADLDGDGDRDLAATAWNESTGRAVVWFENRGGDKWIPHTLKSDWPHATQVIVADLDGDHRPDIVVAAEDGSMEVRWWKNRGTAGNGPR